MIVRILAAIMACSSIAASKELPRWRGFNLLEKFKSWSCEPFREDDFRLISQLGFNFVRLPMDYRCWIVDGEWERLQESQLQEIDQALEYGRRYGIHVCINFHRAPGYTVAKPPEARSVWTDREALRVCTMHWRAFARRYKDIPSEHLSFNLFNEPRDVPLEQFLPVIEVLVEAIRGESPDRLIISDGLQWGQVPVPELARLGIAQATRGYAPSQISHYQASWVGGERFALPTWPLPDQPPGRFYGPDKTEPKTSLVIRGPFTKACTLRLRVGRVSREATLVARAGQQKLWEKTFVCGPGKGEWKQAVFRDKYQVYQNLYERDYSIAIPAGTPAIVLSMPAGDWLELMELGLSAGGAEDVLKLSAEWGKPLPELSYRPGAAKAFGGIQYQDRQHLWSTQVQPWQELAASGGPVIVGEWGAYNKTPHDVFLRWAEDCLRNWQEAGFSWALWNFRGSFGLLDSERSDVDYEDFHGHKLDRKLLDLLIKY
jgi:aryl-phospho-beta-D-glucosidase BglC (GH1 family)